MYEDAEDEGVYDIGGGGDNGGTGINFAMCSGFFLHLNIHIFISEMENVTNRMSSNSIQINYQYTNGNHQEDEHFEDAD